MPAPILFGLARMAAQMAQGGGAGLLLGAVARRGRGKGGAPGGRRRRRRGLTPREKADLLFVKDAIGKTAAANYLNLLRR